MKAFFVSAAGRDGSTLLCTSLNQHPQIYSRCELLFKKYLHRDADSVALTVEQFLNSEIYNREFYPNKTDLRATGFKLLHSECRFPEAAEVRPYLISLNPKVIFIQRKNALRQFLSHRLANETRRWHNYHGENPRTETTEIHVKGMFAYLGWRAKWYSEAFEEFSSLESTTVYYEDLLVNFESECERLCDFLGADRMPLTKVMHQLEYRKIKEIVTNYDVLVDAVKGTEYESMLD